MQNTYPQRPPGNPQKSVTLTPRKLVHSFDRLRADLRPDRRHYGLIISSFRSLKNPNFLESNMFRMFGNFSPFDISRVI